MSTHGKDPGGQARAQNGLKVVVDNSKPRPYGVESKYRGTAFQRWRLMAPYGLWKCADGRELLFTRDYLPTLERYPGAPPRPAYLGQRVVHVSQEWYFNDGTPYNERLKTINAVLIEWGLPPLPPGAVDLWRKCPGVHDIASRYAGFPRNPWLDVSEARRGLQ